MAVCFADVALNICGGIFRDSFSKKKMELIKVCQWADVPKSGQIGGKAGIPACWQLKTEHAAKITIMTFRRYWASLNRDVLSEYDSVCYVLGRFSLLHIKYNNIFEFVCDQYAWCVH